MSLIAPLFAAEVNLAEFLERISGFLGGYYVVLAVMNAVMALYLWQKKGDTRWALVWVAAAGLFVILSPLAASGHPTMMPGLPQWIIDRLNWTVRRLEPWWAADCPK